MRKLIEKYKNMSPEMRMLFAAAGLGSFGTIVYTLDKWIFAGRRIMGVPSLVFTALGIALLMSILDGAGTLVSKGTKGGLTLIPEALLFRKGWAKIVICLCRGKDKADKRQDLIKRAQTRDVEREMARRLKR